MRLRSKSNGVLVPVCRLVFPVPVQELPYESMLTFHLLGSKQAKNPELLCWAVLPLFNNRYAFHLIKPVLLFPKNVGKIFSDCKLLACQSLTRREDQCFQCSMFFCCIMNCVLSLPSFIEHVLDINLQ